MVRTNGGKLLRDNLAQNANAPFGITTNARQPRRQLPADADGHARIDVLAFMHRLCARSGGALRNVQRLPRRLPSIPAVVRVRTLCEQDEQGRDQQAERAYHRGASQVQTRSPRATS